MVLIYTVHLGVMWSPDGASSVPVIMGTLSSEATNQLSDLKGARQLQSRAGHSSLTRHFEFQEEFCYPVECLALTVEEVMHIRQVLVKAELEKYQQYKDVYTALKKGKVELFAVD